MMRNYRLDDPPPELKSRILQRAGIAPAISARRKTFAMVLALVLGCVGWALFVAPVGRNAGSARGKVIPVGDHAVWIPNDALAQAAEGVGADVAPIAFKAIRPIFLLVYWEGEYNRPWVEECNLHFNGSAWKIVRNRGVPLTFSTIILAGSESLKGRIIETLGPLLKHWPTSNQAPFLNIHRGILVIAGEDHRDACLKVALGSEHPDIRAAARFALRQVPQVQAELSHNLPLNLNAVDAKSSVLRFLSHADIQVRREAALLSARMGLVESIPTLLLIDEAFDLGSAQFALMCLATSNHESALPHLLKGLADPVEAVRMRSLSALRPADWNDPRIRVAIGHALGQPDVAQRLSYAWVNKDINEAVSEIAKDAGVRIVTQRKLKGSISLNVTNVDWRDLLVGAAATVNLRVVWESPSTALVISGEQVSDSPWNPFK